MRCSRARIQTTIVDPHFSGFPAEPRKLAATKLEKSDLARASDASLVDAAWSTLRGAIGAFAKSEVAARPHPALVLGGDVSIYRDRIALANSNFSRYPHR